MRAARRPLAPIAALLLALAAAPTLRPADAAAAETVRGLNAWTLEGYPAVAAALAEAGARSARVEVLWGEVEPSEGRYDWEKLDAAAAAAHGAGSSLVLTLRSISDWGSVRPPDPDHPYQHASRPRSTAAWRGFLTALAQRYRGQPVAYEIENEVNALFWAGSLADYLDLLNVSYRALKAADPQAIVLPSAMACGVALPLEAPGPRDQFFGKADAWASAILRTGAFDVVNVHDYYPPDVRVNGWTFASYLDHVRALAVAAGVGAKPIWITETGFAAHPVALKGRVEPGSPETQAQRLSQAFAAAAAFPAARVYWLFLEDPNGDGPFAAMGLTDAGGHRRPAWRAFRGE
jgi:hypothetical protein